MKTVLKDSGVNEENIRAEEFSGFIMHLNNARANQAWKRYLLLVAIALVIIVAVILHAAAAIALSKTGFGAFLLHNPISYVMIGLMLVVMFKLKFKYLLGFMHGKEKQSAREMPKG